MQPEGRRHQESSKGKRDSDDLGEGEKLWGLEGRKRRRENDGPMISSGSLSRETRPSCTRFFPFRWALRFFSRLVRTLSASRR